LAELPDNMWTIQSPSVPTRRFRLLGFASVPLFLLGFLSGGQTCKVDVYFIDKRNA